MLLFNFICVFYLMVLVNSHTISKSIAEYKFDDESDSLTDIDYTRGRKNKHDVFLHKFRRREKESVTEPIREKTTMVEVTILKPTTESSKTHGKTKAHHRFWKKFKMKNKKAGKDRQKRYKHKRTTINLRYPNRITAHENYRLSHDAKRKREASVVVDAKLNRYIRKEKTDGSSTTDITFNTPKTRSTLTSTTDDQSINGITTKLTSLKLKYGMDKYRFIPKLNKVIYEYRPSTTSDSTTLTPQSTTEETEFPGTAQIEELLNDIKARAIQMIADQNPAITELLTTAATEATFEADPILTHVAGSNPGFALTTFVSLSDMDEINKRTVNDSNMVVIADNDSHNMSVRSCKQEAYTMAQNVEDMLQHQLKKIYNKVKCKMAKEYHKEVKTVQSTLSDQKKKVVDKIEKKVDKVIKSTKPQSKSTKSKSEECKNCTKTSSTMAPTSKTRQARAGKGFTKKIKKTTANQETTPSIDDFAMLTLYEQILYKTHEDNVMKMLTTSAFKEVDGRLSKRNPTPDMIDAPNFYDEITVSNSEADNATNELTSQRSDYKATTLTDSVEDTGYEGLVDKISFNDYVNGYKHYLKFQKDFQKDQAEANFSNLVKFQAHKHHKVDDIGKFILNKIPRLPTRKRRYFFDDSDIEYQDVSTKSDDSWFKKHFYMFIDNGPPKKYHTSETVNFKDVTGGNTRKVGFVSRTIENSIEGATELSKIGTQQESEEDNINLDELSKDLEDHKYSIFPDSRSQQENQIPSPKPEEERLEEGGLAIKIYTPHVLSKWFGNKQRRKLRKSNNKGDTFGDSDRLKRNIKLPKLHNLTSNLEARSKMDAAYRTDNPIAVNKKKDGCVSIDVVSQPTSIVKLRSNNSKKGKFKKLLKKLHLIKKKKKQKRQAKVRRFNPFNKLKHIFRHNDDSRPIGVSRGETNDYDIFSSHIDTFKPVKYNIPNLDDLKNQIPNITNEFGLPYDDHLRTPGETGMKEKVVDVEYEKDFSPHLEKPDTKAYSYGPHDLAQTFTKTTPKKRKMTSRTTTMSLSSLDDVMNINIKTSANVTQIEKPVERGPESHHMSLQDIKDEIEKLNKKISHSQATLDNPYWTNAPANQILKLNQKKYMKPKSQRVNKNQGKKIFSGIKPVNTQHNIQIKSVNDFPKLHKFDKNNYLREINGKFSDRKMKNIIIDSGKLTTTEFPNKLEDIKMNKYNTYRDDFNDLLLWHGDILNYDSLTSPSWQDILGNLQNNHFTTPNLVSMRDELAEMNNLLKNFKENTIVFPQEKDSIKNDAYSKENVKNNKQKKMKVKFGNYKKRKRGDNFNDGNLNTMTVITENDENGPNEYYTTKDYVKKNIESSRSRDDFLESILMDTTVMSYDDSINFITENPGKISRSSSKPSKKKNKSVKSKTNQQPQQSFSTPFPMTMGQFELFLKQNDLDVETVTAPIKETPNLLDIHNAKPNTNASIHKKVDKEKDKDPTSELEDDIDPEDQIEYLNQELDYLESDLNYLNDYSIRYRRRKNSHDETTKRTATKKRNTSKDKEVEITIINFDDANKLFKELNTLKAKYQDAQDKSMQEELTTFTPKLILTNKMKPGHKIVKINEDNFRKHSKTTKIDEDPTGLHVYGNSFHYNFLFGPHNKLKEQLMAAKRKMKKYSTHSEVDNEDNGDRQLTEEIEVHRFGREAETAKPVATSSTTEQAAATRTATVTQLWSRFIPIFKNKISLFSKNSTSKKKEKSNSTSTEKAKSKSTLSTSSTTSATTKTMTRKEKTSTTKNKIFEEDELDKYNNVKDVTAPLPADVSVMEHDHNNNMITTANTEQSKTKFYKTKGYKKEEMYIEEAPPDDMIYYEIAPKKHPLNLKGNSKTPTRTTTFYSLFEEVKDLKSKLKRNAPEEKYTAKDVAAIEVVVDLLKNTLNGVTKAANTFLLHPKEDKTTTTNSIQVHIAIPYEIDDKKRSADSQRIRKVFSAKMATPVDLEYQIHSIEQGNATPSADDTSLAPGMYLVVDNKTGSYSLKPVKYNNKQTRELQKNVNQSNISGKVALSKDFLTTINEQLLKLYENLTANINNHKIVSRHVHWDKIKHFFGHDRVCNCKCKANRTMCRACAASDDVVKELTIAFENLSKYMTDHCTEIQTFFWMNPTGGKKLRDLVNRIDGSLSDYYKRVKGKCQGHTCKTFSTYLDKRGVNKSNDELKTFLDCIKELSQNIEMVLNNVPYDDKLKDAGEKFVEITNNCAKSLDKRRFQDNTSEKKQNEYSLDNINVNIICDPSARKYTEYKFSPTELASINCDLDNNNKKKTLRKFFGRTKNRPRNKLFTYYITADETPKMDKRETFVDQLESPLIADTGGSFWQDYLGKSNDFETIFKSDTTKGKTESTTTGKENNKETTMKSTKSFKDKIKHMYPSKLFPTPSQCKVHGTTLVSHTPSTKVTAEEDVLVTQMESLSYNIEELMKIFEKVYHFENYKKQRNHTESTTQKKTTKHKRTKAKKTKKTKKSTTAKMHKKDKHKHTEHTKHHAGATTKKKSLKATTTPKDEITIVSTEERNKHHHLTNVIESPSETTSVTSTPLELHKETKTTDRQQQTVNTTVETTIETKKICETKINFFHKLKQATAGLLHGIKHRITTTIPKHNRKADILMSEMDNEEHKTQVTVFTNGNNEEIKKNTEPLSQYDGETSENNNNVKLSKQTNENNKETGEITKPSSQNNKVTHENNNNMLLSQQTNMNNKETSTFTKTPSQNNRETGEHNNNLLFSQQTNENNKEISELTTPSENDIESNEINTETTSVIYNVDEDGQKHVISEETTTGIPGILILTHKPNEEKGYNELLKSVVDFDSKLKRQNVERTMTDIEDIMMTYSANLWTTKTKKLKKEKSSTPQTNKQKDKHTNEQPDKATKETDYDLVEILRTLQLPTPTGMADDQNGLLGFSIKVVPDTKNINKGSAPPKSTKKT